MDKVAEIRQLERQRNDLLAACEALIAWLDDGMPMTIARGGETNRFPVGTKFPDTDGFRMARAAIARARGKADG